MVRGLGLGTFTAGACVQSLVGEVRTLKAEGMAKKFISCCFYFYSC